MVEAGKAVIIDRKYQQDSPALRLSRVLKALTRTNRQPELARVACVKPSDLDQMVMEGKLTLALKQYCPHAA